MQWSRCGVTATTTRCSSSAVFAMVARTFALHPRSPVRAVNSTEGSCLYSASGRATRTLTPDLSPSLRTVPCGTRSPRGSMREKQPDKTGRERQGQQLTSLSTAPSRFARGAPFDPAGGKLDLSENNATALRLKRKEECHLTCCRFSWASDRIRDGKNGNDVV